MDERELRASLAAIGPILPVLLYDAQPVDGRKREEMCAELGISITKLELSSLRDACSMLYAQHPRRAVELAQRYGVKQLRDLADHCGTTVASVARELAAAKAKRPGGAEFRRRRRLLGNEGMQKLRNHKQMVLTQVYLEPQLRAYGIELAKTKGHGQLSKVIREALWKEVALQLPQVNIYPPRLNRKTR
jgi:hypothetical protein